MVGARRAEASNVARPPLARQKHQANGGVNPLRQIYGANRV